MSQDHAAKQANQHLDKVHKEHREQVAEARAENEKYLHPNDQIHSDHATGKEQGIGGDADKDLLKGSDIKHLFTMFPDMRNDELARIRVVRPGTQLQVDNTYLDLHDIARGEFRAYGHEVVQNEDQLLVSKRDTDYETYAKLKNRDRDVSHTGN